MQKQKILIIRLSAMGDVIFTIPLANALMSAGYEVSWLVSEKGYDLVKNNPCVDKVILAPVEKWKKSKNFIKNFFEYISILKTLRKEKYDIALDTQLIFKSLYWTIFCGAKRRIVAKNYREFAILGGNEVIESTRNGYEPHAVLGYLKYAQHLGVEVNTDEIKVTLPETSEESKNKIDELLKDVDKSKQTIVVSPATTWSTKHWSRDNWRELLNLLKSDYNIVLTGTDKDKVLLDYIDNEYLNLGGKTNLEELRELLSRADLVISLDSGTTHLAWAVQTPKIISIFCSTPESLYAPFGNRDRYISLSAKDICPPCHKRKCPRGTEECTRYPAVKKVYDSVIELLKGE